MAAGIHKSTLFELLQATGGPGFEMVDIGKRMVDALAPYVDEVHTDALGNVVGIRRGTGSETPAPRVLLAAHMDEIALMVSRIEPGGFLRLVQTGGFDARVLVGQEVVVHATTPLLGVIGTKPPHLTTAAEREQGAKLEDLFVDLGMTEARVRETVRVGDRVTVRRTPMELLNGHIAGKALDNRASLAILLECLDDLQSRVHTADIIVAATVQEEVGSIGALRVAEKVRPDVAIAVDVTFGRAPGQPPHMEFQLGRGPAIAMGPNIHPKVFRGLRDTANRYGIPWQLELTQGVTGTDAGVMQMASGGIPCGLVGVPLRYMHTSVEVIQYSDVIDCGRLLARYVAGLKREEVEGLTCF
jgi:putative aminopeptidase FrvX